MQETRLYNVETGQTVGMRSKEQAHDYRYFPEPDLVPLRVSEQWLHQVKSHAPRNCRRTGATVLSSRLRLARIRCAGADADARDGRLFRRGRQSQRRRASDGELGDRRSDGFAESGGQGDPGIARFGPKHLGELVAMIGKGELSGKLAKEILPKMLRPAMLAQTIMDREGLKQISDTGALEKIVDDVLAREPEAG